MKTKIICHECFAELPLNETNCQECGLLLRKHKDKNFKTSIMGNDFPPDLEGVTWINVPSPFKPYPPSEGV